jgi:acetyl esterase/lipase
MKRSRSIAVACLTLFVISSASLGRAAEKFSREEDVIYGRKYGTALTMDVFKPTANANGGALVMCISGGWISDHDRIQPALAMEPLSRGYTVFAVVHGSQPKFTIPECVDDMNRAIRYIRTHAKDFDIDPNRIGVTGASAGGHLSLMLGCAGCEGDPKAKDPVDRASSCVQAVACFFPPTDFLNYGEMGKKSMGIEPEHQFKAPFDFRQLDPATKLWVPVDLAKREEICRAMSPIYHVNAGDAPTLILHGDADKLVPLQQSQILVEKFKEAGVPCELIVKQGGGHGVWPSMFNDLKTICTWFDTHMPAKGEVQAAQAAPPAAAGN